MLVSENNLLEYHRKLLGLSEPWNVIDVKLDVEELKITIEIKYSESTLVYCPECNNLCSVKDKNRRTWRHLDSMQFQTFIQCDVPRADCEHHGVLQVLVPWAEPKQRFTLLFEGMVVLILQSAKSQSHAVKLTNLGWKQLNKIQKRAVERGLHKRELSNIEAVGIDEKSFRKGHKYITQLNDLTNKVVLEVAEGRDENASKQVFSRLPEELKDGIKVCASDFWPAYKKVARSELPNAIHVIDKFHVSGHVNKSIDMVRKAEHREQLRDGSGILKNTKYLWLTNKENWNKEQKILYKELQRENLRIGRAFAIKESFREFWKYRYLAAARNFFKTWYFKATHSRLKPVIKVSKMLKSHLNELLEYFKYPISNSTSEMLNGKIQSLKADARGFRNFENFRIAILFHCGGLKMSPLKRT